MYGITFYQVWGNVEKFKETDLLFEGITLDEARNYIERIQNFKDEKATIKEAFKVAISQKKGTFDKFINRICALTSDTLFDGYVHVAENGIYFKLAGTRSSFAAFVSSAGKVIRKPININYKREYSIQGCETEIYSIRCVYENIKKYYDNIN